MSMNASGSSEETIVSRIPIQDATSRQGWRATQGSVGRNLALAALSLAGAIIFIFSIGPFLPNPLSASPSTSPGAPFFGFDAFAYWAARPGADAYAGNLAVSGFGFWRYAPVWLPLLGPLQHLPFNIFAYLVMGAEAGALLYLTRRWFLASLIFVPVCLELYEGNIYLLMTAAIVFALRNSGRRPASAMSYALLALTKVTPFVVIIWHLLRREWRPALFALLFTGVIVAVSFSLDPTTWSAWRNSLTRPGGDPDASPLGLSLSARGVIALVLLVVAARGGWTSLVVLAAFLAMPAIWWHTYSVLIGLPITLAADWRRRRSAPAFGRWVNMLRRRPQTLNSDAN